MYIDATFACVPNPFTQMLVVMVFSAQYNIYIPCVWILMTGKTTLCYQHALSCLQSIKHNLDPKYVGVDFEPALFNTVKKYFPNAEIIGCYFHFLQAIRKHMISIGFPPEEIKAAMECFFYMIVLPPNEIDEYGIDFIMMMILDYLKTHDYNMKELDKKLWITFWAYFRG